MSESQGVVEAAQFRWKPLAAIGALAAIGLVILQTVVFEENRANRFLASASLATLAAGAAGLHLVLFSGLKGGTRARLAGAAALTAIVLAGAFHIRGFSGNIEPRLAWRFLDRRVYLAEGGLAPIGQSLDRHVVPAMAAFVAAFAVAAFFSLSRSKGRTPAAIVALLLAGLATLGVAGISKNAAALLRPSVGAAKWDADRSLASPFDYPQFLGPLRDGKAAPIKLDRDWEAHPPRLVWRRDIGEAWSAFAIVGEYAVTQERSGDNEEATMCLHVPTGDVVWRRTTRGTFVGVLSGNGPRATPTIHDDRVYSIGSIGTLSCLDRATGEPLWQAETLGSANEGNSNLQWGVSCAPLVVDGLVVVSAGMGDGPALLAFDADTGDRVWSANAGDSADASYASPMVAKFGGSRQIIMVNAANVTAHEIATGATLWSYDWPGDQPKVPQPVQIDDSHLYIGAGYGLGSRLLEVVREASGDWAVRDAWKSPASHLKPKFTNVVASQGVLFGLDDGRMLVALEAPTGKLLSRGERYGHGQIMLVGDLLLVQAESGEACLIDANPLDLQELGRFAALDGDTWSSPALAGRFLLVRSASQAACYELTAFP